MSSSPANPSPSPAKKPAWSKRTLFLFILAIAGSVAGIISLVVYTVLDLDSEGEIRLAVMAPLSGPDPELGQSIQRGAEEYADQVNKAGGLGGHVIRLMIYDDKDTPDGARQAARDAVRDGAVAAIGHWSDEAAKAAAEIYQQEKLPALSLAEPLDSEAPANPWLFSNSSDQLFETKFLANYVRNVTGEKMISIIHPDDAAGERLAQAFDEVMQRFGTRVLNRWSYPPATATTAEEAAQNDRFTAIATEARDKKLIGAILIMGGPRASARALSALRLGEVRNRIVGPRALATTAFRQALVDSWKGPGSAALGLNDILTVTPLLFDTSGELAQGFRNNYLKHHRTSPDWLGAVAFDASRTIGKAMEPLAARVSGPVSGDGGLRSQLQSRLVMMDGKRTPLEGLLGPIAFDARGVSAPPTMAGVYNGKALIAALTQLSPIREENVGNYLDEIVAGRALYVNDRFMYKTNVVYSGVKLEKIYGLDLRNGTVKLDLLLWFRWKGDFNPQDIMFTNAVEPITLDKADREVRSGEMIYRSYRVRGQFFLNYSKVERTYGAQILGLSFHHRSLNRNNLMYVSDVLGMDLNSRKTLAEQISGSGAFKGMEMAESGESSFLRRLGSLVSSQTDAADPLLQVMLRSRVLAGVSGWTLERAWISQEMARRGAEGDPAFIGFGKPAPEFSQVDMGSVLKPDQIEARDFVPRKLFPAIAIFSLVGALVASLLDHKERGQFWRMQTLGLRLISWPLLLMAGGNLILDYSMRTLPPSTLDMMVLVFSALWWLVPARLLVISVERFIWVPLEIRAGRKIPNVIRMITALAIYLLAVFGVVAFVMGQTITSLLATSGLMAMIIGLAIQANIANIFSGIVLNIERPLKIGDFVRINTIFGQVLDITWRTIRIRHKDGQLVCLANAKVSEAEIHNFSGVELRKFKLFVNVDPIHDPKKVAGLIRTALADPEIFSVDGVDGKKTKRKAFFFGIVADNGLNFARYMIKFRFPPWGDDDVVVQNIWNAIWEQFRQAGIDWQPPSTASVIMRNGPVPLLTVSPSADDPPALPAAT